jgi:mRNA interferase RelE/StbE
MPSYQVFILPSATKEIDRLDVLSRKRTIRALEKLTNNPRPSGCKKLIGTSAWRIRVGNIRIIYTIEEHKLIIEVVRVAHRKNVYK